MHQLHLRIKCFFVIADSINNIKNFRLWEVVLVVFMCLVELFKIFIQLQDITGAQL